MSTSGLYKPHMEIYRFPPWVLVAAILVSFLAQTFLLEFFRVGNILDLPLLVVIYFGFSRRNPSTGLLLGCFVGLLQDALSYQPVGLFGAAKTVVGFLASSLTSRVDTDNPAARALLIFGFFLLQNLVYAGAQSLLPEMEAQAPMLWLQALKAGLVNAIVGVILFSQFDRVRNIR